MWRITSPNSCLFMINLGGRYEIHIHTHEQKPKPYFGNKKLKSWNRISLQTHLQKSHTHKDGTLVSFTVSNNTYSYHKGMKKCVYVEISMSTSWQWVPSLRWLTNWLGLWDRGDANNGGYWGGHRNIWYNDIYKWRCMRWEFDFENIIYSIEIN